MVSSRIFCECGCRGGLGLDTDALHHLVGAASLGLGGCRVGVGLDAASAAGTVLVYFFAVLLLSEFVHGDESLHAGGAVDRRAVVEFLVW